MGSVNKTTYQINREKARAYEKLLEALFGHADVQTLERLPIMGQDSVHFVKQPDGSCVVTIWKNGQPN